MTKIWRKNEWEQLALFPVSERERENFLTSGFRVFVFNMFDRNCRERREHGQEEYKNVFRYYRKNHAWLLNKFMEKEQPKPKKKGKDYTKCSDVELLRIHHELKKEPLVDCIVTGKITIELISRGWRKLDNKTWTWELP